MPDAQGFPTPDEIINGPPKAKPAPEAQGPRMGIMLPLPNGVTPDQLSEDQIKAAALALSGLTFMFIAMRPTVAKGEGFAPAAQTDATGCDYLTVLHGDKDVLMAAKDALGGVIDRMYTRKGIL